MPRRCDFVWDQVEDLPDDTPDNYYVDEETKIDHFVLDLQDLQDKRDLQQTELQETLRILHTTCPIPKDIITYCIDPMIRLDDLQIQDIFSFRVEEDTFYQPYDLLPIPEHRVWSNPRYLAYYDDGSIDSNDQRVFYTRMLMVYLKDVPESQWWLQQGMMGHERWFQRRYQIRMLWSMLAHFVNSKTDLSNLHWEEEFYNNWTWVFMVNGEPKTSFSMGGRRAEAHPFLWVELPNDPCRVQLQLVCGLDEEVLFSSTEYIF